MSNPAAPQIPEDAQRHGPAGPPEAIPDVDGTEGFGPDVVHPRSDDPASGTAEPEGPGQPPPAIPLDDADFAPDEA